MPIWELYKIKNKTKQKLGTFMEYFRILPIWVEGSLGDQVLMPTIVSSKLEIATLHRRVWWINLSNYSEILSFWAHQLKYFQAERAKKKQLWMTMVLIPPFIFCFMYRNGIGPKRHRRQGARPQRCTTQAQDGSRAPEETAKTHEPWETQGSRGQS